MALFQDDVSVTSASAICCETEDDSSSNQHNPYFSFVSVYTFFLLMFQTLFRLSDAALNVLFNFFALFLSSLSHISIKLPEALLAELPKNVQDAHLLIGSKRKSLKHYICCPNCHSIYERESCCAIGKNGEVESLTYVKFPSHPQLHHRTKCNTQLMKRIKLQSWKISLQPHFVYPYKSLIESLQEMITRKVFLESCEMWRERDVNVSIYSDVYDGYIWQDFLSPEGIPFLSLSCNFAFQLNVDWFQPFEHTQHSEGAIYMSIMNLPRHKRFLAENIILVGVIPGPKEPHIHINFLLEPLVHELQQL